VSSARGLFFSLRSKFGAVLSEHDAKR
jgi:hypothetical protein